MAYYVQLEALGWVDMDSIVQVYSPDGSAVSLDSPSLAVRFSSEVSDLHGKVNTNAVLLTNPLDISRVADFVATRRLI